MLRCLPGGIWGNIFQQFLNQEKVKIIIFSQIIEITNKVFLHISWKTLLAFFH